MTRAEFAKRVAEIIESTVVGQIADPAVSYDVELNENTVSNAAEQIADFVHTEVAPIRRALSLAKQIIQQYQVSLRNSKQFVGVDLVEMGFCQGFIYRDALEDIGRLERGEEIPVREFEWGAYHR